MRNVERSGLFHLPHSALGTPVRLSLRANMVWTLAGNTVYAGCQWAMLVVLAKVGTTAMVGQFALALALTAPVLLLTNLQLRQVQATDARHQYTFAEYLALRLVMTLLALIAIVVLVLIGGYGGETAGIILVVGLAKAFESISDVFFGLLQQWERMDRIAISMMIKGGLSLLALGLGVVLTGSVLWGAVGLAVAWAVILLSYDLRMGALVLRETASYFTAPTVPSVPGVSEAVASTQYKDKPRPALLPSWQPGRLARLVWLALPLGVTMLLISLNTNIPRYFIQYFWTTSDLGIFAAISYLMVAGTTVISAIGQAAAPRLASYYVTGDKHAFRVLTGKLLTMSLAVGAIGMIISVIAGRQIMTLIYSSEYGARVDLLVWVMLGAALWYVASVLGYAATASRRIRLQPLALAVVLLASVIACYALIPAYGLLGAGIATAITSVVGVLAYAMLLI
jgi:O-antigen/teichoic acid export membrane protein